MKKSFALIAIAGLMAFYSCDQKQEFDWRPAPNPLLTNWADDVDPEMPWPEYPRPQMKRENWINLNGLWDYQLTKQDEMPEAYIKKILVPYPVESALSGVSDSVGPDDLIWYRREIEVPADWEGQRILIHFEAVDWEAKLFVNGESIGTHRGGYDPFSFDITEHLQLPGHNEIVVSVSDPTDTGHQPRGKQVLKPGGIMYTPSSGIWQTVWLEAVPESYIEKFYITTYPTQGYIDIDITSRNTDVADQYLLKIFDRGAELSHDVFDIDEAIRIDLKDFQLWSPSNPYLYDMKIQLMRNNEVVDVVDTYFGMREISKGMAEDGFVRLFLNGKELFHNGPLDQGFWPDGLYTPPTEEAMKYDILASREMGFIMLRKHVKVENRRFYYWCDKIGIMVWQDMPSTSGYVAPDKSDLLRPQDETEQFKLELKNMILTKYNHPSIVMWVPFNEGWGQFDTEGIVEFIYSLDKSRLVNNTSGWADRGVGDVIDIHHYPDPRYPEPESDRASVLGEFGGLGLFVEGHTWEKNNWGYRQMNDSSSLLIAYEDFYSMVWHFKDKYGLAAAVYTQTTDVETETNGLITYDRKVIKMDPEILSDINTNDYVPAPKFIDDGNNGVFKNSIEVKISSTIPEVRYTLDGSVPSRESPSYSGPITVKNSTLVKAAAFSNGKSSLVVSKEYKLSMQSPPLYRKPFDSRYSGGGHFALIDGEYGGIRYSDGRWQGYRNNGLDVVIDLGGEINVSRVGANFLLHPEGWIFLPGTFAVYSSDDGKEFTLLKEIISLPPDRLIDPDIRMILADSLDIQARYIRITANTIGKVPEWHETGKGQQAWMFIDEIVIE